MARTVWHRTEDLTAYALGRQAAMRGETRNAPNHLLSYNEKAAFNDGWDSLARDKPRRPRPRHDGIQ